MNHFRNSECNDEQQRRHSEHCLDACRITITSITARTSNTMIESRSMSDNNGIIIEQQDDIVYLNPIDYLECFLKSNQS